MSVRSHKKCKHENELIQPHFYGVKSGAGFTLVEMLVALGLFVIVATVVSGALVTVVNANRQARGMQVIMNNLHFALDDIARSARVGTVYRCSSNGLPRNGGEDNPANCPGGDDRLAFITSQEECVIYRLQGNNIEKRTRSSTCGGGDSFVSLTSEEVVVEELQFYVTGALPDDGFQPKILIVARGEVEIRGETFPFDVQTAVVQRVPDN